jgi:hypothetical protein
MLVFCHNLLDQFFDRNNLIAPASITAGKGEGLVEFARGRFGQEFGNAIRRLGRVTGPQALIFTLKGYPLAGIDLLDKFIIDHPSGQPDRTFDQRDIIRACV